MKQGTRTAITAVLFLGLMGMGTACHRRQGPAERAGEKIDDAAQKVKDKIDPPGPAEKAGRKIDRAVGNDGK